MNEELLRLAQTRFETKQAFMAHRPPLSFASAEEMLAFDIVETRLRDAALKAGIAYLKALDMYLASAP